MHLPSEPLGFLIAASTTAVVAAISDGQINAVFSGGTALLVGLGIFLQKRSENRMKEAAHAASESAKSAKQASDHERLEMKTKIARVIATLAKIHADGNSTLANSQAALATTQRRIAQMPGATDADIELANKLEEAAAAHVAVQTDLAHRQVIAEAELAALEKGALPYP